MAMPAVNRRWTAPEVRALIAESPLATPRYELVDGELLVTTSPNRAHQLAGILLWKALDEYLSRHPVGRALTSPFDIEVEPGLVTQPDVFVVPPDEWKRLATSVPARKLLVAAEVLSPSSGHHDRVTKRPHYQRHVPEYWIVDLDARLFERWRPHDERAEIITQVLEWHPAGATEAFRLDLARYFADVFDEGRSTR
jgi:Uma2 family endonuclease